MESEDECIQEIMSPLFVTKAKQIVQNLLLRLRSLNSNTYRDETSSELFHMILPETSSYSAKQRVSAQYQDPRAPDIDRTPLPIIESRR
jgi:hypothetical protein